jgi:hypothetical protein
MAAKYIKKNKPNKINNKKFNNKNREFFAMKTKGSVHENNGDPKRPRQSV